jgi:hypothetical protein
MPLKHSIVPNDSILRYWLTSQTITETPLSYSLVCAMSALGACLKRNVWIDQVKWKVFANLSILLVGPSGIGKDTAIDAAEDVIGQVGNIPCIGGKTIEFIQDVMLEIGDPACCYIPAPEITAFLGSKDYQKSMVQELTHILTTKNYVDVSTKGKGIKKIPHPTLTVHAGSTAEWLHKAMPEGSMEGGLWPRFLIVHEEYGSKSIPLVKLLPKSEVELATKNHWAFVEACKFLAGYWQDKPGEMSLLSESAALYENWYRNRLKLFSPTVRPYANRSRDQVLRLAMLCAISRRHDYIEAVDMQFGIDLMQYVAGTIDQAMCPPTTDARLAKEIRKILPASQKNIIAGLGAAHKRQDLMNAISYMLAAEIMYFDQSLKLFVLKEKE